MTKDADFGSYLFPGGVACVWHAGRYTSTVQQSLEAVGFEVRAQIIRAKDRFALSRGSYHWQHEPAIYCVRNGSAGWTGDRKQSTLWQIPAREGQGFEHGTQKRVECMKRPIENNSSPGQAVYEPFSGSGTTIIGAEITGRSCHAIEIDPSYVDVAVERWQAFTGDTARLEGDGRTFAASGGRAAGAGPGAACARTCGQAKAGLIWAAAPTSPTRRSGARWRWLPTASRSPTLPGWLASIPRRCASTPG